MKLHLLAFIDCNPVDQNEKTTLQNKTASEMLMLLLPCCTTQTPTPRDSVKRKVEIKVDTTISTYYYYYGYILSSSRFQVK
jgi:hypothetical protein